MPRSETSLADPYDRLSTPAQKKEEDFQQHHHQKKKCCTKRMTFGIILVVVGIICLVISGVFSYIPNLIETKLEDNYIISNPVADSFANPFGDCDSCAPYYYYYHPFEVTNTAELLQQSVTLDTVKPTMKLAERGPYVYRKYQKKLSVTFSEDGGTVSYRRYDEFVFEAEKSCQGCTEDDAVITPETGYWNVMSKAGGETQFMKTLLGGLAASAGLALSPDGIWNAVHTQGKLGKILLQLINGYSSMDPETMYSTFETLAPILKSPSSVLFDAKVKESLAKFKPTWYHNGLFARRTVRQLTRGNANFLAGLAVGSQYTSCTAKSKDGGVSDLEFCTKCKGDACKPRLAKCSMCLKAAAIKKITKSKLCPEMSAFLKKSSIGEKKAEAFIQATCGKVCEEKSLFCLAPLPGALVKGAFDFTGMDNPDKLVTETFSQQTGKKDSEKAGHFTVYKGISQTPIWGGKILDRNPTPAELAAFDHYNLCSNTSSVACTTVRGSEGRSFQYGGASLSGLKDDLKFSKADLYIDEGRQNISIYDTKESVKYMGIDLHRFRPKNDVLVARPWSGRYGTGVPVSGVQNLAYVNGFLSYVSFPMYLNGDVSLLDSIDLTMRNGKRATKGEMYAGGKLKKEYDDVYSTYLDINAQTGKTMNAHKRLMASYAMNKITVEDDKKVKSTVALSDLSYPNFPYDVIFPVYWGQEKAGLTQKLADLYESTEGLANAVMPVFIIGLIAGVLMIVGGSILIHRSRQERKFDQV